MNIRNAAIFIGFAAGLAPALASEAPLSRPKAGPVEIMRLSDVKPGMKGTAWTVFQGSEPEPVPIEIIGLAKNMWGPKQDIILAKMGGKAIRTNVAAGMSGSPVYINGKLAGAIALRLSVFSPDAICGITPIELMLEINDFDKSRPDDARTPEKLQARSQAAAQGVQVSGAGIASQTSDFQTMVPIDSPLALSGITEGALREFGPMFQGMGIHAVQAGGGGTGVHTNKPAAGWEHSLNPGDSVAGILVDGDMSATVFGTVTYNDGKRVLAFGHPMFNLGPINMPMSKSEVVTVLASSYQPSKMANATDIVGSLRQDRHSGIMGVLGTTSEMIPVTMKVRSLDGKEAVRGEKNFHFNVFVHQKWTPYLMMLALYNSVSGLNEFVDEATYRLNGKVELNGTHNISLSTMAASGDMPMPAPMALAGWFGDKFNRLYLNNINTPDVKSVNVTVDLIPDRRVATIENAWAANNEVQAGRGSAREGLPAAVSRRTDPARFQGEASGWAGQGRSPDCAERCRYRQPPAEYGGVRQPVHGSAGDGFADQPGAHQQQTLRVAGAGQPHGLLRRQDAAQPALLRAQRDAGRAGGQPRADHFSGNGNRANGFAVRLRGNRELFAADTREVE